MQSGLKVKISGLTSEEGAKLNGTEGIIDHYSKERGRYAVNVASGSRMIKEVNLQVLETPAPVDDTVFAGEEAMLKQLTKMGMPAKMIANLTPSQKKTMFEMTQRQDIVDNARKAHGITVEAENESLEMKPAAGGLYSWRDASNHVYMEIKCKCGDALAEKKEISCIIREESILVTNTGAGGEIILQGNLFQKVHVGESTWEVTEDGKLCVTLKKLSSMRWLMVTR